MKLWGQPAKGRSEGDSATQDITRAITETEVQAQETARRTRELLSSQGWCFWKCSILGGGVIAVMRDEGIKGVPQGYPIYTEAEVEKLFSTPLTEATLRLVHEAKKVAGAKVSKVTAKVTK